MRLKSPRAFAFLCCRKVVHAACTAYAALLVILPKVIPHFKYIPAHSFLAISLSMPNRRTLSSKLFANYPVQLKECTKRFRHLIPIDSEATRSEV